MIDISDSLGSLGGRAGHVAVPVWLAGTILRSRIPQAFAAPEMQVLGKVMPLGLMSSDLEILPYLLGVWTELHGDKEAGTTSTDPVNNLCQLRLDTVDLRRKLPEDLRGLAREFCGRIFGLRVVDCTTGIVHPFFEREFLDRFTGQEDQTIASGVLDPCGDSDYRAAVQVIPGMLSWLIGVKQGNDSNTGETSSSLGLNQYDALRFPVSLWEQLSPTERDWLIAIECAARWSFTWVRADGCVALDVKLSPQTKLAETLKPLATLGSKLVDHGWLLPAVDDAPILFDTATSDAAIRLLWVLHPARAQFVDQQSQLPQQVQPEKKANRPELPVTNSPVPNSVLPDSLMSKMRLVAAEELQKIRAGGSGQYVQLKKRYLESLDPQGRQLIANLEKMLAPELLEEHLRHGLVRYMIEHPSAWQSATSSKPAH